MIKSFQILNSYDSQYEIVFNGFLWNLKKKKIIYLFVMIIKPPSPGLEPLSAMEETRALTTTPPTDPIPLEFGRHGNPTLDISMCFEFQKIK